MVDHLSYSSITNYLACPRGWAFKYVENRPTLPTPELAFGSAFHGAVEAHLTDREQSITDLWNANWKKQTEQEIQWDGAEPASYQNDGIRILGDPEILAGLNSIHPGKDEIGVKIERKVELHVPGVPIPVIGYIDVITDDGVPGDFKTSARSWTTDKAEGETQPLFYLAALNQLGIETPGMKFRHYVFVKTKKPQFQMLEHAHTINQLLWLFGMIKNVWNAIDREAYPENPTGWKCNPNYCDFWNICRGK